jgi:elongation factor Ts
MATINAADVAKLRRITLAGMMDCKKALEEADGNFDKAIEIIRKKGQAIANKRADKDAGEGVVLSKASADGKLGAIIVLNSETDFVAKNADFLAFANKILDVAIAKNPADLNALLALPLEGTKIADKIVEYIGIIGEKLALSYFEKIEAAHVQTYIHPGNRLLQWLVLQKPVLMYRCIKI